jgi:hypothetical protein
VRVQFLPTPQNQGSIPPLFFRRYSHHCHQCEGKSTSQDSCDSCIKKGIACKYGPVKKPATSNDGSLASQSGSHRVDVDDLPPLPKEPSSDPPAATSSYTHPTGDHSQDSLVYFDDPISFPLRPYPGTYSVPGEPYFSPTTNYLHGEYLPGPSSQTQFHFSPPTTSYPHDEYLPGPSQSVPQVEQSYPVPLMPPENYIPCHACGGSVYDHGLDCVYYTQ